MNLICVEDGIDSSKDAGKLMISVLSAVAEIERENIRTQTMAGREQKAREGRWNGGFAPYGYKLVDGQLLITEDEAEVEGEIEDTRKQIQTIRSEQISGENVYQLLMAFDQLYSGMDETDKKELMCAIIERIDLYPKKRPNGNWIRNIVFTFPVPVQGTEVKELPLEKSTLIETVCLMSRIKD